MQRLPSFAVSDVIVNFFEYLWCVIKNRNNWKYNLLIRIFLNNYTSVLSLIDVFTSRCSTELFAVNCLKNGFLGIKIHFFFTKEGKWLKYFYPDFKQVKQQNSSRHLPAFAWNTAEKFEDEDDFRFFSTVLNLNWRNMRCALELGRERESKNVRATVLNSNLGQICS